MKDHYLIYWTPVNISENGQALLELLQIFFSGTSEKLKSYKVGCVVTVAITDITNKGVIGHLEGGLPVYATKDHLRGKSCCYLLIPIRK